MTLGLTGTGDCCFEGWYNARRLHSSLAYLTSARPSSGYSGRRDSWARSRRRDTRTATARNTPMGLGVGEWGVAVDILLAAERGDVVHERVRRIAQVRSVVRVLPVQPQRCPEADLHFLLDPR
jgi:hypothetical protein